ncbi:hypothetical protein ES704_03553 [subsurface metagenome]|jgi:DNA-binding MarR family transcriptional regulator
MKSFDSLIEDLEEERGLKIVFDRDKFKKALEKRPQKTLNFQVWFYLCLYSFNDIIPPIGKIARDLKLEVKTVKEAIKDFKHYGVLKD